LNQIPRPLLLATLAFLSALGVAQAEPRPLIVSTPRSTEDTAARTALGEFAFDVYRQVAADNRGRNVFCSPYSLYIPLAMCAEGARGETALEMGRALRFPKELERRAGEEARLTPWDITPIHAGLSSLSARFNAPSSDRELLVANALWVDGACRARQSYLETITGYYGGGVYGVDFGAGIGAVRQINAWAEKQTRGRIKDLLSAVSPLTRLVITNALYFKSDWAEPFTPRESKDEPFLLGGGHTIQARTMIQSSMESVRYGAFEGNGTFFQTPRYLQPGFGERNLYPDARGFTVLEMPYKGGELSMLLIVPRSENGLPALEKELRPATVKTWTDRLEKRAVHVHVPTFKMETAYEMGPVLQRLGMKRAFVQPGAGGAQFEGMTLDESPNAKLYISSVVHKTFVEVNEKGTEAAAATAVVMAPGAAPPLGPTAEPFTPTFKADRPFLFLIRNTKTDTILFIGRVLDPRQKG
jgi:serine protease inhibitor